MSTPDGLLADAFQAALDYWRANNGGTRAGLVAHLQTEVGIADATAARWVDAMTAEAFAVAMTDGASYADFRARLVAVGPVRALKGARCVFENLLDGALRGDAVDEMIAKATARVGEADARIAAADAALAELAGSPASATRDVAMAAVAESRDKVSRAREGVLREIATLVASR